MFDLCFSTSVSLVFSSKIFLLRNSINTSSYISKLVILIPFCNILIGFQGQSYFPQISIYLVTRIKPNLSCRIFSESVFLKVVSTQFHCDYNLCKQCYLYPKRFFFFQVTSNVQWVYQK
eukprot:TRINITY_DN1528_c0_g1_i2.p1 TRINITY_DN1528_c0_g1~~TRINITY_DN1528_c0_g1_i2.p1  ORF type:complete len:119 (-),score=6.50 TRINITY_DN1528_c0_g1_i2:205-561(-)